MRNSFALCLKVLCLFTLAIARSRIACQWQVQLSSKLWLNMFVCNLLLMRILHAFLVVSGTPKHVNAEDVELFRQACHMSRQVSNFHVCFFRLF